MENNGKLDTISIKDHLIIAKKTALKTMTELTILEVTDRLEMENNNDESSNNAFQIQLKDEFNWFLSDEFKKLRENFGKEYYNEYISSKQQQKTEEEEEQDEI